MKKINTYSLFLYFNVAFLFLSGLQALELLSLNTWNVPFQRKKAMSRAARLSREIPSYDVALLQEVFDKRVRKRITRYNDVDFEYTRWRFPKLNSGLVSFSKLEFVESRFFAFDTCRGAQCMAYKGVTVQLLKDQGRFFYVLNTHLQAYEKDHDIRLSQFKTIQKALMSLDARYPVLFAGDFNIIARNQAQYQDLIQMLNSANFSHPFSFVDTWTELKGLTDLGITWDPIHNPWAKDEGESFLLQRLDYIFYRPGLEYGLKLEAIELVYDRPVDDLFLSDHYGLHLSFGF